MMRMFLALTLLAFMLPQQAGASWLSLWRNADQQGEALLQQGDASGAAKVYTDPHRKAYAKLEAGDYEGAAHDLGDLRDSDADYNRGNALAHAGDLQGALNAYDAALKSDPDNQDARHNRELVANALKQKQPQQQGSSGKQSNDGKHDEKQGGGKSSSSSGEGKQGDQAGQGANGKDGQQSQQSAKNPAQTGQAGDKEGKGQNVSASQKQGAESRKPQNGNSGNGKSGNGKSGQEKQAQQHDSKQGSSSTGKAGQDGEAGQGASGQQAQASGQKPAQTGQAGEQASVKDDAEQARRDAEASLAQASPNTQGSGTGVGDAVNDGVAPPSSKPLSEKQLAQEQWLRSIPDDPGGLLRRKFLIEHMMRQQKAQP